MIAMPRGANLVVVIIIIIVIIVIITIIIIMTVMPRGANLVVVVVGSPAQCRHTWVERETRRPWRFGQLSVFKDYK